MEQLKSQLIEAANDLVANLGKDSKAAAARARKATLKLAKLGKDFRKASIEAEKK